MKSPKARWNNVEITWFATWLISVLVSLFVYRGWLTHPFKDSSKVCSFRGIGDTLYSLFSPNNWFGILTIALTVYGAIWVLKQLAERWPQITRYKLVGTVLAGLAVALIFSAGC
jgi:hypothetical protein